MPRVRLQLAVLVCAAATATACSFGGGGGGDYGGKGGMGMGMPKKAEPVTVVEIDHAHLGSVADTLAASATVESEAAADIIPISSGIVVSVHKDEGDPVKKGDLLAVLDNVSLDASAERAAGEQRRLQEQYDQMERLRSQGAVSERELSDLRYQLESARTSMREATRSKGQTRLTAPFDGVVAKRDVRVGELAGSGAAAFQVVDLAQLRVVASLPERDLPRVKVGQPATLTSAYDTEHVATGIVERIAPIVDAGSGTFRVTVAVGPDQNILRPGQFVTVDLEVDRRHDVVVVPRKAIVYDDGAPVVYTYSLPTAEELEAEAKKKAEAASKWGGKGGGGESSWSGPEWLTELFGGEDQDKNKDKDKEAEDTVQNIARRTPVELGLLDHDVAQITSGLEADTPVIVVGQSHLRDLAKVRDAAAPVEAEDEADEDEGEGEGDSAELADDEGDDDGDNG